MDRLSLSDPVIVAAGVTLGEARRGFRTHEARLRDNAFKYSWIYGCCEESRVETVRGYAIYEGSQCEIFTLISTV